MNAASKTGTRAGGRSRATIAAGALLLGLDPEGERGRRFAHRPDSPIESRRRAGRAARLAGSRHASKKLNHWVGCSRTTVSSSATQARAAASSSPRAHLDRRRDAHGVAVPGTQHAERGHHRDARRPRQEERPERKRRGTSEERDLDVAPGPQRPVALERHHLAAPERRQQVDADARVRAGHEAHATAVTAHPSLEGRHRLGRHHDMGAPRGAMGEKASRQLPVADVRGHRHDAPLEVVQRLGAGHRRDVLEEAGRRPAIRRDQIAEAHREVAKDAAVRSSSPAPRRR